MLRFLVCYDYYRNNKRRVLYLETRLSVETRTPYDTKDMGISRGNVNAGQIRVNEINEKRATGVNETMAGHVSTNSRKGEEPTRRV